MPGISHPHTLLADGRVDPLTVDGDTVSLSWSYAPGADEAEHVAIQLASDPQLLAECTADLHTVVLPPQTIRYTWPARDLPSGAQIYWRAGLVYPGPGTAWSTPACFERPLLRPEDWAAEWITDSSWLQDSLPHQLPVLKRYFTLDGTCTRARLRIAAAGVIEVRINGKPASPDVLAPGYSTLPAMAPAVSWDVTQLLTPGHNTITVELAAGMASVEQPSDRYTKLVSDFLRPRFLLRLDAHTTDGHTETVVSDESWICALGSTLYTHWYGGEDGAETGSAAPPSPPRHAVALGGPGLHPVWWPKHPPLRVTETRQPVSLAHTSTGERIADFGVNIAGWPELSLSAGRDGGTVTMRPSELLNADGQADQRNTGSPTRDTFTVPAGTAATWHPKFTYHGFRYVELSGPQRLLDCATVRALAIHAGNRPAGLLTLSDPPLQTLHDIIVRAIRGNMFSVFTDCPHREKLGWLEQLHLCFGALTRNFDVYAHLRDELTHIAAAQLPSGAIPNIAPEHADFTGHGFRGDPNAFREDPNWGGAQAILPWLLYTEYGDHDVLASSWQATLRYLAYLHTRSAGGILDFGLGDWIALDASTPRWLVATSGYLAILDAAINTALVLADSAMPALTERRAVAAQALTKRVMAERTSLSSQGSLALILRHAELSNHDRQAALVQLIETIHHDGARFTLGENCLPALIQVLHDSGHDELLYQVVTNPTAPGYGFQIARGATSLAESWTSASGPDGQGSQNHFMLGMIHDWLHGDLAGLRQHDGSIAWSKLLVRPTFIRALASAHTRYDTVRGTAEVSWQRSAKGIDVSVTVPPTAIAVIELATQGGTPAVSLDGHHPAVASSAAVTQFHVPAGTWRFRQQ